MDQPGMSTILLADVSKLDYAQRRFAERFPRGPVDHCWEWTGPLNTYGYGKFAWSIPGQRFDGAHRFAYLLANGEIRRDLVVRHHCDNRRCVNPGHLAIGTHRDNATDCVERGRHFRPTGELHPMRKLREDDVRAIRSDSRSGVEVAAAYGISRASVSLIRNRKNWRHVA